MDISEDTVRKKNVHWHLMQKYINSVTELTGRRG